MVNIWSIYSKNRNFYITIFEKTIKRKIKIIYAKLFAIIIVIISLFVIIYYLKRINYTNIITLSLTSVWLFNTVLAILDYHKLLPLVLNEIN